jgi:DNA polymerase III alpha subunit
MSKWDVLRDTAVKKAIELGNEYHNRIIIEIKEIEKQGLNNYWVSCLMEGKKWDTNPNGLVLPYVLKMTSVDPIKENIEHEWVQQTDFPDIDSDYLPIARSFIKEYATNKYVHVCSVGNWNTYKPKSAIQDATRVLGGDLNDAVAVTKNLPDDFDDLSLEDHKTIIENKDKNSEAMSDYEKYKPFYEYWDEKPDLIKIAFNLTGKIKSQGTHAGGLIIADRPVDNIIPLSKIKENWTSQWTEGKNTQLSKFGLIKFDILGLKTMLYIWKASNFIEKTHGIKIDWSDIDPSADIPRVGMKCLPDGSKEPIPLDDEKSFDMCNELRTESIFQVETHIQKSLISEGGVKSFWDLVAYNAIGRPGPIECASDYIYNRDDEDEIWAKDMDERIIKILRNTYGIILFQEDLAAMWIELAGFTVPEAEKCRKIISKKWLEQLDMVKQKWLSGASKTIGEDAANEWWTKMHKFGRYCFNKSHAVCYSLISYMCVYLKAHYPAEWWASVMSECHQDKRKKYMAAAKIDGMKFDRIDVNSLELDFSVRDGNVISGLSTIKKIGNNVAGKLCAVKGPFDDIDDFVEKVGKNKTALERLIKLGAFDSLHKNRKALWMWYSYKYCSGKEYTAFRKNMNERWVRSKYSEADIQKIRDGMVEDYRRLYPNRRVIPKKILNWSPTVKVSLRYFERIFKDFSNDEILDFEKEFLGYHWTSPLSKYQTDGCTSIEAKKHGIIEGIVEKLTKKISKNDNVYYKLFLNDGLQVVEVMVWEGTYNNMDKSIFEPGTGVKIYVDYSKEYDSFRVRDDVSIFRLKLMGEDIDPMPSFEEEEPLW